MPLGDADDALPPSAEPAAGGPVTDPLPTHPTLESGPQPLTVAQGRMWGLAVALVGVLLALVLPFAAQQLASVADPPGALRFGKASVIPATGWSVQQIGPDSLVLAKDGVRAEFRARPYQGSSLELLNEVVDQLRSEQPELTSAADPRAFETPTGDTGQLTAVAGLESTALVAVVSARGTGTSVVAIGPSQVVPAVIDDLETMVTSMRIQRGSANQSEQS